MNNQYFTKDGRYSPKRSEELRQARKVAPQGISPQKPTTNWESIQKDYSNFKQSNLSLTEYLIKSR